MYIPCLIIFYLFLFLVLMVPFEANFYFICLSSKCMISNHTMKAKDKLCTWGKLKVSFFVQYHRSLMGKNILHILIWTLKNLKTTIHETSLDIWFLWIYKLRRTKGKTKLEKLTSICKVHFLFSHRDEKWFLLRDGKNYFNNKWFEKLLIFIRKLNLFSLEVQHYMLKMEKEEIKNKKYSFSIYI
jgi:hypothetical protein